MQSPPLMPNPQQMQPQPIAMQQGQEQATTGSTTIPQPSASVPSVHAQNPQNATSSPATGVNTIPLRPQRPIDNALVFGQLPPTLVANGAIDRQIVAHFSKIWQSTNNYTGESYDVLDDKAILFQRICQTQGITPEQFHAVFPMTLAGRAMDYYIHHIPSGSTFSEMYHLLKHHFDTEVNHAQYNTDWTSLTFSRMKSDKSCENKEPLEVLQALFDRLQRCQRALGPAYKTEEQLIDQTIRACRGEPMFTMALFNRSTTYEQLCSQLRSSLETHRIQALNGQNNAFFTDRTFKNNRDRDRNRFRDHKFDRGGRSNWKKTCYICGKQGCFSTKHSPEEQSASKEQYRRQNKFNGGRQQSYNSFLVDYEGDSAEDSSEDEMPTITEDDFTNYFTATVLGNNAFTHRLIAPEEIDQDFIESSQFMLNNYSDERFQGIIPDTGAAKQSTAGKRQYLALKRHNPIVKLNTDEAGAATIRFGNGDPIISIGAVNVETPVGKIKFHVLEIPTPFLLCLEDMDQLGIYLNNVTNVIVSTKTGIEIPVVRKWGHPWFFLTKEESSIMFLTEGELRRLHARFGHPSVDRLHKLLTRAGHDVEHEALVVINKFCHFCQIKGDAPKRFKFTLKDEHDFNYEIIVDAMYLDSRPVLHVVDASTSFQAGRFLQDLSARKTWETLKMCWIDTYLGPPDVLTHDAGTNFAAAEFQAEAKLISITCHQVPVEAHWSIGKVERYHAPVRRAFEIIKAEMPLDTSPDAILQMALKAVNDTAGPDGLVPTLLVFGTLPRMTIDPPPTASSMKRAAAVSKAMMELRKLVAKRKVNDALNTRNGPDTIYKLPTSLAIGSEVRVYREKAGWTGPHKVLDMTDTDVTVDMINGPIKIRSTHVQPYNRHPNNGSIVDSADIQDEDVPVPFRYPQPEAPRKRGRPRKNPVPQEFLTIYMTKKEKDDFELARKLRAEGKITTAGAPFEASDALEIDMLIGGGVLKPVKELAKEVGVDVRIFKSRMVREIKGSTTNAPYEKSRLVVQGYNDEKKHEILTQSPTIQRCSQRLILALAPYLRTFGMILMLRDITQAYPQSKTTLNREIYAQLPLELKEKYPEGTILRVVKPLYGIAEAGPHWFHTYQGHHKEKLNMETSSFDPCLLITKPDECSNDECFAIVGLQTDDTLDIGTQSFMNKEEEELEKAGFKAKPCQVFQNGDTGDFNGCRITVEKDFIVMHQKGQAEKLIVVNKDQEDSAHQYVEQRARGAYIASICQPEAAFDYSTAAQVQQPEADDIKKLNVRIDWQITNKRRGINFVDIDLATAKLMVFTDGSFANNRDMTSQIGYIVALVNEEKRDETFTIRGNIIHWSSTKCKRVTRSVLASEIYGLVGGFDLGFVLASTLQMITGRMKLSPVPLVVCTDSFSVYECLVKLGTTTEKRLMIDIMSLRQSYERREITEIRWFNGDDNPADAMTKAVPNKALEKFISTNKLDIRVEGWVQR